MTAQRVHERSKLTTMTADRLCVACGRRIAKGARAWYAGSREAGYRCRDCGRHPAGAGRPEWVPLPAARYAGKCHACGRRVAKGEPIWWRPRKPHWILCEGCPPTGKPAPDEPDEPTTPDRSPDAWTDDESGPAVEDPTAERAERGADGIWRYALDSIGEAVADASRDYAQNEYSRKKVQWIYDAHNADQGGDAWTNHYSRASLAAALNNPPAAILQAIEDMRAQIDAEFPAPCRPRRRIRHGLDFGEELDADRFLAREPNCWDRSVRVPRPKLTVGIAVNVAIEWDRKAEHLLYRGAAILALADALTERGFSVGIDLLSATYKPTSTVTKAVGRFVIKRPEQPLDLGSLALAACEIAFARLAVFVPQGRHLPGKLKKGLGRPMTLPAADRARYEYAADADVLSREAAVAWLDKALARTEAEPDAL